MSAFDDFLSDQFLSWETRGRGWHIYEYPVVLEPPFVPFPGYSTRLPRAKDDGRRHTAASSFFERLMNPVPVEAPPVEEPDPEPFAEMRDPLPMAELQLVLPKGSRELPMESLLRHLCRARQPAAFELLGRESNTTAQFAVLESSADRVSRALESYVPGLACIPADGALAQAWEGSAERFVAAELGLAKEFILPLGDPGVRVLDDIVAGMDGLRANEMALFQVLFEPVVAPWPDSIPPLVLTPDAKPVFNNRSDLISGAKQKISAPFFAVVIRLVACAADASRGWEILTDMAAPLAAFDRRERNHFIPLRTDDYPPECRESDLLHRLSRRTGMLLNLHELIPLVTPPVNTVARNLQRQTGATHPAPELPRSESAVFLGKNLHAGRSRDVFVPADYRVRHMHVIGGSGTGKSTLLSNLIREDIANGQGLALFDPHGDLVDAVLGSLPEDRIADVVLIDASDEEYAVGFNILAAHSEFEKAILASDLTSIFRRLSTSWGDQMESVFRNAILAFLESSQGGTLLDLRNFLVDPRFRKEFLSTVTDPEVLYYWQNTFAQLTGGKSVGPVLTRLDGLLSRKPIRSMVAQDKNLNFSEILDEGRILLVKLPQGLVGQENTALLGSLIIAKLQMAAMSRQRMEAGRRRDFWCYIDECQHFITASMAEILGGARKYRFGMVLAHQEMRHLDSDKAVASAVRSNCCVRTVFKVSETDARELQSSFQHFEAADFLKLGVGDAICSVDRSDWDFNLTVAKSESADPELAPLIRKCAIAASREKYSRLRSEVEAELLRKWQESEASRQTKSEPRKKEPPASPPVTTSTDSKKEETVPLPVEAEKPPIKPEPITSVEPLPIKPAPEPGRGGPIHREVQARIQATAAKLHFLATLESQVGTGGADLLLARGNVRIAVEISVTTQVSHEVGNLLKCLSGTFSHIAFVSSDLRKTEQVKDRLKERASEADFSRVGFYQVETFLEFLRSLPSEVEEPKPKKARKLKVGGWNVTTKVSEKTSEEEAEQQEKAYRSLGQILKNEPEEKR